MPDNFLTSLTTDRAQQQQQQADKAGQIEAYGGGMKGLARWSYETVGDIGQRTEKATTWISALAGAPYGSEEYWQYVEDHPELQAKADRRRGEYGPDPYRISQETKDIYQKSQEAGEVVRSQADEMVDVAGIQRGMAEMPSAGLAREAMDEGTVSAVSAAQEAGGSSASSLGAIAQIQAGNVSSVRDAAIQTQVFRDQAEKEYTQALRDRGGAEVIAMQSEIQGLQEMGRAKEQQYQVNVLDKFSMKKQADIAEASAKMAQPLTFWEKLGF